MTLSELSYMGYPIYFVYICEDGNCFVLSNFFTALGTVHFFSKKHPITFFTLIYTYNSREFFKKPNLKNLKVT